MGFGADLGGGWRRVGWKTGVGGGGGRWIKGLIAITRIGETFIWCNSYVNYFNKINNNIINSMIE